MSAGNMFIIYRGIDYVFRVNLFQSDNKFKIIDYKVVVRYF